MIKRAGLGANVKIIGVVYDFEEKIRLLLQSKLFLLPTYEENWAIVIGEALECGLPVICYDLPEIKPIWEKRVVWIRKGDVAAFAASVEKLLQKQDLEKGRVDRELGDVRQDDWHSLSSDELDTILAD
jgi:glycosyltransferase involved in cell wall biosynthesis